VAYDVCFVAVEGYSTCGGVHFGVEVKNGRKRNASVGVRGRSLGSILWRYRILLKLG
jgi:hypothetical protein